MVYWHTVLKEIKHRAYFGFKSESADLGDRTATKLALHDDKLNTLDTHGLIEFLQAHSLSDKYFVQFQYDGLEGFNTSNNTAIQEITASEIIDLISNK